MNQKKYEVPRTDVERAFVIIWQQLLEKERIGIHDNFFELGGNSFLAAKIVHRIKLLGYQCSLTDLFLNQSIAELSEKIDGTVRGLWLHENRNLKGYSRQDESIIPIQKNGDFPPIFVIHSTWAYIQLSIHLGKNQPFYCLEGAKLERIKDSASFYINKIKSIQPKGPYYIGGFCGHGLIALEIASQLEAEGEVVGSLFLFETYSPAGIIPRLSWRYMKLSYNKLVNWPSLNRKKFLKDELRQAAKKILYVVIRSVTKRQLTKTSSGKFALLKPVPINFSYLGKVVIFKASSGEIWAKDDPEMGWSKYLRGEIEAFTIEGSHTDIFLVPGVLKLSKIMRRVLESSRNYLSSVPRNA